MENVSRRLLTSVFSSFDGGVGPMVLVEQEEWGEELFACEN